MSIRTLLRKPTAAGLALLLVSCTAAKPVTAARGPTGPHDLGRFVLVVQETPDRRVTHDWKPLEDFDLKQYQSGTIGIGGVIKRTSTPMDDDHSVGAAVIITGVVFYVVMSSVGILILAPALLLTSPDVPAEPHLAEAFQ